MNRTVRLTSWVLHTEAGSYEIGTPRCWEELGLPKNLSGPYRYSTTIGPVDVMRDERVLLRFGGVSYACTIVVDGKVVGHHRGLWDSFEVDVTDAMIVGREHSLDVLVEKPASLNGGPDSTPVEGNYPTRQVLAGFLPYVWGHIHGGIWQPVNLLVVPRARITELNVVADHLGRTSIDIETSEPARGAVRISDPNGAVVAEHPFDSANATTIQLRLPDPRPWSPNDAALYVIEAMLDDGDQTLVTRTFGLRTIESDPHLLLNDQPLYPRMILSWGWYPDLIAPDPGPDRVRADLMRLRSLGFNGVKLCLWVPPDYYFRIADELGMLIWLELPLWLPIPSAGFGEQIVGEVDALVRQARQHPSVIIYTLGCELGSSVGPDLLERLYRHVKRLTPPGTLVCDNSGSGEAYGGADLDFADFYDHHLYAEPEHLKSIFDHFAPGSRPPKPWLMGEFCDLDAYRDPRCLSSSSEGPPWWASTDLNRNPQGARWQFDLPHLRHRLAEHAWLERSDELERIGNHAAMLHRKITCEYVRSRADTSGYVITGERDTPISTSGIIDDHDRIRVSGQEFTAFNRDTVLLYCADRRRRWTAGGDRPAPVDPYCHPAGSTVGVRVLISHHGSGSVDDVISWSLRCLDTDRILAGGQVNGVSAGTGVHEICHLDVPVPSTVGPVRFVLQGSMIGREPRQDRIENSWIWWILPADPWSKISSVTMHDPSGRFSDLQDLVKVTHVGIEGPTLDRPLVATRWTPVVERFVRTGGRAVVALDSASDAPMELVAEPFWRESLKVIEPHEWWREFPHRGLVELQFGAVSTSLSMDMSAWVDRSCARPPRIAPLLRRLDARTGITHDYAVHAEIGAGSVLFTTLNFDGGQGSQPTGLSRSPAGASLLATWIEAAADLVN